jgi:hypothetical protein
MAWIGLAQGATVDPGSTGILWAGVSQSSKVGCNAVVWSIKPLFYIMRYVSVDPMTHGGGGCHGEVIMRISPIWRGGLYGEVRVDRRCGAWVL